MTKGDFVVITAASSSVGLAAIEMAKAEGATSLAVTRSQAKKEALLELGADHVIVSDEEDLPARVKEISGGKGARLIFDPVGGRMVEKLAEAAAFQGMIFEYGSLSGEKTPLPLFAALSKSLTFRGYTLFELMPVAELREAAERYVFERVESGAFKPRIAKTFRLDEIVEAHRYMESNEQIGKIVVTV